MVVNLADVDLLRILFIHHPMESVYTSIIRLGPCFINIMKAHIQTCNGVTHIHTLGFLWEKTTKRQQRQ